MKENRPPCALILTSLPVEYDTVCNYIQSEKKDFLIPLKNPIKGFRSIFNGWNITTITTSSDNIMATMQTEYAIRYCQPDIVIFLGIAGKIRKSMHTGDVVVATKIYGYQQGPNVESTPLRPEIATMSYTFIQQAYLEARKQNSQRQDEHPSEESQSAETTPRIILAPIIAGEKGLPTTSELYNKLCSSYGDAVAIEMEGQGYGFLPTILANHLLRMLVIRGVTEPSDDKQQVDTGNAATAVQHACTFTFQLLTKILQSRPPTETPTPAPPNTPFFSPVYDGIPESLELFFAYAEEDEKFVQRLQPHLSEFKRARIITNWQSDSTAGEAILKKQIRYINRASIILLLISPDFLYSDYLLTIAEQAMKRQHSNRATVIPVLLRPTANWRNTFFGNLQAIPRDGGPVSGFPNIDRAIEQIANEIRTVAEKVKESRYLNSRF